MGSTIYAIQCRLSPQNLMAHANGAREWRTRMAHVKETTRDATIARAQEVAGNIADTARENSSTLMDTRPGKPCSGCSYGSRPGLAAVQLLFNCCSIAVQLLFNCCSIAVQLLFNCCSICGVTPRIAVSGMTGTARMADLTDTMSVSATIIAAGMERMGHTSPNLKAVTARARWPIASRSRPPKRAIRYRNP
jgi:hypothetical protein